MKTTFLRLVNGLQRVIKTVDRVEEDTPEPGAVVSTNDDGYVDPTLLNATMEGGSGNGGKIVQLDEGGRISSALMPTGYGDEVAAPVATEALSAGDYVNIYTGPNGADAVRRADASAGDGKLANGFVLEGFNSGATTRVFLEGTNGQVSGRKTGALQYLSATEPGKAVEVDALPTTEGHAVQVLGTAVSKTAVTFEPQPVIIL